MYNGDSPRPHAPQSGWKRAFLEGLRKRDEATKPYEALMNEYIKLVLRFGTIGIPRGEGAGGGDADSSSEEVERLRQQLQKLNALLLDQASEHKGKVAELQYQVAELQTMRGKDDMLFRSLELEKQHLKYDIEQLQNERDADQEEILRLREALRLSEKRIEEQQKDNDSLFQASQTRFKENQELKREKGEYEDGISSYKDSEAAWLKETKEFFRQIIEGPGGASATSPPSALEERSGGGNGQISPSRRSQNSGAKDESCTASE
uniref:Uncharacterized protein n=1 Tax=Chromera velia CCMP2878 TaxID=1169474 RepID=A0A0G4FCP0_9ALVE|mmetsp:Transcript_34536/g.68281  ORF Transcript_34536/g.68281 Transcript_34536/m.68281 type:complete len:263 (+) Transcript_34536:232-1020(+)|eukprot:Cvel_16185.t1-p1 / transcript=Cvel_16185.t1 / gene=Cvel_16185 / organism=Chromera_velia_CCMP2878 / gene_product=hypothetical protein / transcript_product=hypothetical protein / location=Cvel_scaffold1235:532-5642(+) / protein_length=262 / sequence_SO=supercontig / SO=protein_coding / is_pseudo=false